MAPSGYLPALLDKVQKLIDSTRFFLSSVPNVDNDLGEGLARQLRSSRDLLTDLRDYTLLTKKELQEYVRRDSLEFFRQIFLTLEKEHLLNPDSRVHLVALYLVYQPRIQASLNETITSWNNHALRTERYKSPLAIYELSKETAINLGYWNSGGIGDDIREVDENYGVEGDEALPASEEAEPTAPRSDHFESLEEEIEAGIVITDDEFIAEAREALGDMDFAVDDGSWGMDTYCEVVIRLSMFYEAKE
ncbi:hypothetical protein DFP72DRAFT_797978 [Ephemerocybe angulata]|uniref:Integrase core domain-containing protein n=1 Tax=Ephemerocybe angulata TaxID=980116 RepID=A0A8H6IJH2_9AGAR|nr:hypothetical protein DFP72DRAFT_797978 [Tulosesus angulatus]